MSQIDLIIQVMGGEGNIGRHIKSPLDYVQATREKRVSIDVIRSIRRTLPLTNKIWSRILDISETTLQRKVKEEDAKLDKKESEAAFEISELVAKGIEVYEDMDDFNEFLHTKNTRLGNVKPIELLDSSIGRQQIIHVLNAIAHGIYS